MNIKEAEKLVRKHLSDKIGIEYHTDPPVTIYGFNPEENFLFSYCLLTCPHSLDHLQS